MDFDADDFQLFDVPRRFRQDGGVLDGRWRALQAQVHPDRFASVGAAERRAAAQWSVRVNEAFRRLKEPLARAAYLCELHGAPINADDNTAMPAGFLMQQMDWRESLDAADDAAAVERLGAEVASHRLDALQRLGSTLDEQRDFGGAAQQVRALMFVERFADDVEQRLRRLEGLQA